MKEIHKRFLTGIVYVSTLLLSVYGGRVSFSLLLLLFYILTLSEFIRITKQKENFLTYLLSSIFCFLFFYKENTLDTIILSLVILIDLYLVYTLLGRKAITKNRLINQAFNFLHIGGGIVFLSRVPNINLEFDKDIVMVCLALIWANDSFAYLIGKAFGKRKLFPSTSPKKTIEGFAGGLFFTIVLSLILSVCFHKSTTLYLSIGLLASIFGTLGDLVQSKFKRHFGVKDSGNFLPGHGGFYDRLDSLILFSPFVFLILKIYKYVS